MKKYNELYLYPEVQFEWKNQKSILNLITPWLELSFEIEEKRVLLITQSILDLKNKIVNKKTKELLFLLKEFPLVGYLPRNTVANFNEVYFVSLNNLNPSPLKFFEKYSKSKFEIKDHWCWKIEKMEEILNVENTDFYDPLNIYSTLSRKRYLEEYNNEISYSFIPLLNELKDLDENIFFNCIGLILKQTYYITSNCSSSLSPVLKLKIKNKIKTFMANYILSEVGHENLILNSFKELDLKVENFEIFEETRLSMEILKLASEKNLMALACCLSVFESGGQNESDVLAEILKMTSKPKSAKGLETHFLINKNEEHAKIGFELASKLPLVSKSTVLHTIQLMELLTNTGNLLNKKIYNILKTEIKKLKVGETE